MKKSTVLAAVAAIVMSVPAQAQDDGALVEFSVLKPEIALKAAQAAMEACREAGYQVGVAVVDRFGLPQVFLRDRFAGPHVHETATRKAWTAVSFRTNTTDLAAVTGPGSASAGIRQIGQALPLGGGMVIEAQGSIVAGIGVSGAPAPELDDNCAAAGIAAIEDEIAF